MNEEELQQLVDDHYASESQTLTTGAEQNLLKLAEMRGRMSAEQAARWKEIKEAFVRTRRAGGKGDDPVARVTGALGGVDEALQRIHAAIGAAAEANAASAAAAARTAAAAALKTKSGGDDSLGAYLAKLDETMRTLGKPSKVELRVDDGTSAAAVSVVNVVREHAKTIERVIANLADLVKNGAPGGPAGQGAQGGPVPQSPPGAQFGERIEELIAVVRRLEDRLATVGGGSVPRFDVALGASSPSNFYRGMDGDDVVMHGGVFVATYAKLPPIGAALILAIELPGGNRFEVAGTVAWTQDELGDDSPAGFGARLASAPEDARAMIAQFVNHREPLIRE
jgi:hypothetical protein